MSSSQLRKKKAIRCTLPSCRCECFSPGKTQIRTCDSCKHGWVSHAIDKLGYRHIYQLGMQVEVVQPNIVFDIASLMLYGTQATPIRLKILLDRLFSVLQHEEVLQVLHGFGWSYEDYARGYILQDVSGRVLDKWSIATREEEQVILQQFLRFGETRSIAQEIILQDSRDRQDSQSFSQTSKTDSDIKKFIERSNMSMSSYMRTFEARHMLTRMNYPNTTSRLMSPPILQSYPSTTATTTTAISATSRDSRPPVTPAHTPPSRLSGSPLGRLQIMQPYDYRREQISPTVSPSSNKSPIPSSSVQQQVSNQSPQNLSLSGASSSPVPVQLSPLSLQTTKREQELVVPQPQPTADESKFDLHQSLRESLSAMVTSASEEIDEDAALNYSTKGNNSSSVFADRKVKHLRKSANPIKRHWVPSAAFGNTFISPSGKKRVLCTACNKTFCDKGALKIHYSAVHLKEMHKCTVDGCNMMFSSRRSRNRHSANPNPKLHMPQKRKMTEEGSPETHLVTSSPSVKPMSSHSAYLPTLTAAVTAPVGSLKLPVITKMEQELAPTDLSTPTDLSSTSRHQASSTSDQSYYADGNNQTTLLPSPSKVLKMEVDTDENLSPSSSYPPQVRREQGRTRSSRKRKSMMPTRYTQMDEVHSMSDDNSNDALQFGELNMESTTRYCIKETRGKFVEGSKTQEMPHEDINDCNTDHEGALSLVKGIEKYKSQSDIIDSELNSSFKEIKENAIKNMDTISQVKINTVVSVGSQNMGDDDSDTELEEDAQANTATHETSLDGTTDDIVENNQSDQESNVSTFSNDSNYRSRRVSSGSEKSPDSSSLEIPVDKENPRRCQACGKIFQNHFGVKTHYQNVHLKLMHTCTVEGCNAAFPSKRSRDRHSANLNLHRKLLSTSGDDMSGGKNNSNQSLRDEFLPRIYDTQFSLDNLASQGQLINNNEKIEDNDDNSGSECKSPTTPNENGENGSQSQSDHSYSSHTQGDSDTNCNESLPSDQESSAKCHICKQGFRDNLVLKEHYEKVHPKEMFHCTISGCDKIFSTRKSRNRHSQNNNLHRHISPGKTNGTAL